ncbi:MAG: sphingomyelinase [Chlamydiota bacterium]|jgi:endonuclease/exonuclease/phosphatase family metal-dependent hydrolase
MDQIVVECLLFMAVIGVGYSEGVERRLLEASSVCAEPFCKLYEWFRYRLIAPLRPGLFNQAATKTKEVAIRIFVGLGLLFTAIVGRAYVSIVSCALLGLALLSRLLRSVGFFVQKKGFTYVRGEAEEIELHNSQAKVLSWNVCGVGGGMSIDHGGVLPWRQRAAAIVEKIVQADADVVVLQEIYDTELAERLIKELKGHYAHFFIHIGPSHLGSVGGLMVFTRCAVSDFTSTSFGNNSIWLNRTFCVLDVKSSRRQQTPCLRVVGTHLIHDSASHRAEQVAQIVDTIAKRHVPLPTVVVGDWNMERDGEEGAPLRGPFEHGYKAALPTRTNEMLRRWSGAEGCTPGETIDYVSVLKGPQMATISECQLVEAFDDRFDPNSALSDHHGLIAQVAF